MDDDVRSLIEEAIDAIKSGNLEDALLALERAVHPKFNSSLHANGAYLMHKPDGPKDYMHDFFAEALGHQVAS